MGGGGGGGGGGGVEWKRREHLIVFEDEPSYGVVVILCQKRSGPGQWTAIQWGGSLPKPRKPKDYHLTLFIRNCRTEQRTD